MRDIHPGPRSGRFPSSLVLLLSLACTAAGPEDARAPEEESLGESRGAVVYGTDNRQDVYAHPDATLKARAQQSTVALMFPVSVNTTDPNNVTINAPKMGARYNLCATERFWDDPAAAVCSGTLIDHDLVLTAGHCINTSADCANRRFVFNYYRTAADTLRSLTTEDIFSCAAVVARKQGSVDYAVVRLDRPATPRFTPAPLSDGSTALAPGQNVAVIGSGTGIPFKLDSGGSVRDPRDRALDYFVATTDTFTGNSGSGVYETSGYTMTGILVRGDTDFVDNGGCNVVHTCSEAGCRGEDVTYVYPALDGFCRATNNANPRLCGSRTADFNKDGSLDVLWHHRAEDKTAIWYLREGDFLSEELVDQSPSDVQWRPVSTGDFNSDGHLDILRHHGTGGQLAFWFMRGGTVLSSTVLQGYADVNWSPVTAGDFDSDGNLDVLWHHRTQGQLSLWFMKGGTLLSSTVLQGLKDVNWSPVTAGDFNGDGDLDILWHHRTRGQLALWFMRGGTLLSSTVLQGLKDVNWYPVAAGDFNGDGNLDVLWHHRTQGQLSFWFMQAGTLLSSKVLAGYSDVNWRPISTGDLNGDGGMDVLWHHRTGGQLALWFIRGGTLLSTVVRPGLPDVNWKVVR